MGRPSVWGRGEEHGAMPHRVLVVDDEESIRSMVKDYLEGQGYKVITAADGDEGISLFRSKQPQLALIDFLLPRKNGFAVAEAIRSETKHATTPIIMMSGVFKNPKTAVEAREKYQVVEFLSKPIDLANLSGLIERSLAGVPPAAEEPEPPPPPPKVVRPPTKLEAVAAPPPPAAPAGGGASEAEERPPPRGLSYYGPSVKNTPAPATQLPKKPAPSRNESLSDMVVDGIYQPRPFPVLGEEGTIDQHPVALLLSTIRYDQTTGMLDLTDQGTHRRIYIIQGNPTFMQSNAEGENVGALLLRRGRITEPDFERCLREMKDKGRTLQQALLELRLVTEHDLATAYKLLAGQLLPLALGMSSGTYRWRETDAFVGRVPEGKFEPVSVLFDGIKRHVHPPQILKFFKGREDVPLVRTSEFEKLMPFFRRAFSATNIAAEIDGSNTYRSLTRAHSSEAAVVVPQLFALATSGMAVLPRIEGDNAVAAAVHAAAAEVGLMGADDDGEMDLGLDDASVESEGSGEEKKARAKIQRYHAEIMSQDFFRIFGVERGAEDQAIKAGYFELAKTWNQDAFGNLDLGHQRKKLDEILGRITEAYETITNKSKREEYLLYLDRKAKGLPTDANEMHKGEQLFEQAAAMIRRRDWLNARNVLKEATRLNPDPLYFATLGYAVFNLDPNNMGNVTEAVQLLKRAVKEQEGLGVAYQYLGQIAAARGQAAEAKKWWTTCLEWEPNNVEAQRGLRGLANQPDAGPNLPPKGNTGRIVKK